MMTPKRERKNSEYSNVEEEEGARRGEGKGSPEVRRLRTGSVGSQHTGVLKEEVDSRRFSSYKDYDEGPMPSGMLDAKQISTRD